jgi:hypothetical protein
MKFFKLRPVFYRSFSSKKYEISEIINDIERIEKDICAINKKIKKYEKYEKYAFFHKHKQHENENTNKNEKQNKNIENNKGSDKEYENIPSTLAIIHNSHCDK